MSDGEKACIDSDYACCCVYVLSTDGMADVVYLLWSGVEYSVLVEHERALLAHYHSEFIRALATPTSNSGDEYTVEQMLADYDLEFLDHVKTAIPYLLGGLNAQVAAQNATEAGFLTYEFDPRVTASMCERALKLVSKAY